MAIIERRYAFIYGTLVAVFVLFGTSMTVVGATLPRILADFAWGYGGAGIVMAAGSIAYFLSTYAAGKLIAPLGPKLSLALGGVLVTVSLGLFAAKPSLAFNVLVYAALGLGQGLIEVNVNYAVARIDPDGRAMSLMHAGYSVGAVIGPFVIGFLMRTGLSWTLVYRAMALLFLAILAAIAALPLSRLPREAAGGSGAATRARGAAYALGFITLFLYVGVELGISNWVAELFVRVFGASETRGSFMVALFWAGLLAGRVGIPLLFPRAIPDCVLGLLGVCLALSSGLLAACAFAGPAAGALAVAAVALAGLACSTMYPIVITLVGRAYPEASGAAIGFASTGGGLGSFLFVFLMSRIAKAAGIGPGFGFYALVAVLTSASAFALSASVRAAVARRAAAPAGTAAPPEGRA